MTCIARRVETTREGWEGHGEKVAELLAKLCACVAEGRGPAAARLDALCLAARLHGLGLIHPPKKGLLRWTAEPSETDRRGSRQASSNDLPEKLLSPGQELENITLVAALLEALLGISDTVKGREGAPATLDTQVLRECSEILRTVGDDRSEILSFGRLLSERHHESGKPQLRDTMSREQPTTAMQEHRDTAMRSASRGGSAGSNGSADARSADLLQLASLFEVADVWVHLTTQGLGGQAPESAASELRRLLDERRRNGMTDKARSAFRTAQNALLELEHVSSR